MSERQAPPRCIDSPDPTTLAARFEAWWQTSPRRNQNLIGHSDKRTLAFDAFEAGAFTSSGDAVREALAKVEFPYQETFNAIGDAVEAKPHGISISVHRFQSSLRAALAKRGGAEG